MDTTHAASTTLTMLASVEKRELQRANVTHGTVLPHRLVDWFEL